MHINTAATMVDNLSVFVLLRGAFCRKFERVLNLWLQLPHVWGVLIGEKVATRQAAHRAAPRPRVTTRGRCHLRRQQQLRLFACGEADRSSRDKLCSSFFFLIKVQKKAKTVKTNMVSWAINFKSEVRPDLRGCLEATVASKPHFLCWSPIDGSS